MEIKKYHGVSMDLMSRTKDDNLSVQIERLYSIINITAFFPSTKFSLCSQCGTTFRFFDMKTHLKSISNLKTFQLVQI